MDINQKLELIRKNTEEYNKRIAGILQEMQRMNKAIADGLAAINASIQSVEGTLRTLPDAVANNVAQRFRTMAQLIAEIDATLNDPKGNVAQILAKCDLLGKAIIEVDRDLNTIVYAGLPGTVKEEFEELKRQGAALLAEMQKAKRGGGNKFTNQFPAFMVQLSNMETRVDTTGGALGAYAGPIGSMQKMAVAYLGTLKRKADGVAELNQLENKLILDLSIVDKIIAEEEASLAATDLNQLLAKAKSLTEADEYYNVAERKKIEELQNAIASGTADGLKAAKKLKGKIVRLDRRQYRKTHFQLIGMVDGLIQRFATNSSLKTELERIRKELTVYENKKLVELSNGKQSIWAAIGTKTPNWTVINARMAEVMKELTGAIAAEEELMTILDRLVKATPTPAPTSP